MYPALPSPATLRRMPSSIPLGMLREMCASLLIRPVPRQWGHFSSDVLPLPPHSGHSRTVTIWPNILLVTIWTCPDPPHLRHVVTLPSLPPVPLQGSHTTVWGMSRLTFFPSRTSFRVISRSYLRDSPC